MDDATVGGDVGTVTITVAAIAAAAVITANRAADCCGISKRQCWQRIAGKPALYFMKGLAQSPSRWHGVVGSTTVGGDVHTVTIGTVTTTIDIVAVITTNRAAGA